eukprot:6179171-Pleurochrysis_carterae.AAC.2
MQATVQRTHLAACDCVPGNAGTWFLACDREYAAHAHTHTHTLTHKHPRVRTLTQTLAVLLPFLTQRRAPMHYNNTASAGQLRISVASFPQRAVRRRHGCSGSRPSALSDNRASAHPLMPHEPFISR